jgi:23S rRNA pseudouridine1911/1915/1917 synthase
MRNVTVPTPRDRGYALCVPEPTAPTTLLEYLAAAHPGVKRTTLRRWLAEKRVRVAGRVEIRAARTVVPGEAVEVRDASPSKPANRYDAPFAIVYEDDDLIVIDKPAGLLTSTVPTEKRPTALALIREHLARTAPRGGKQPRGGLIHRLDRDASGLLVFSKNEAAFVSLKRQLKTRTMHRSYLAVAGGKLNPLDGTIRTLLVEYADGSVHVTHRTDKGGEPAVTHYQTLNKTKEWSLVKVTLETGRKHQIRAHLAARSCPILNDSIYAEGKPQGRLMLAAVELALDHPASGERITLKIDPPPEFGPYLPSAYASSV